jgi:ATP-dependent helicase HrpB
MQSDLPVLDVLPNVIAALDDQGVAVLVAPPGAGKTTAVAPALLGRSWATGRILLLSPRRLAARAAAERMAVLAGEPVGRTIGYRTRMDSRVSAATRIEVLTEGIFTRLIQDDPELTGISAVLFDEVHERSLEGDLGLALALDAREALRPDLRLVAMSATLDGARYAALLGDAPVIEAQGRMFPVAHRYLGRDATARIEDRMAAAIRRALAEEAGSVLAFLPGAAEIERTFERLAVPDGVAVHRLYGALDGQAQRAAIEPAPAGTRKVVLATSIAETSLTIDGVTVVVDSGLARRPRFDRATGLTRLVTERVSQAAATQRAGRAGRTAPGTAWRLWDEGETRGLPPFDPPEILESDLTGLVLDLAVWGVSDPGALRWLDPPPERAVEEGRARLRLLGALDEGGRATVHGQALAKLPLPPRLAHMLLAGGAPGLAAKIAAVLQERGLGGRDSDLATRLRNWDRARDRRSESARGLAARWARLGGEERGETDPGRVLAHAYPDRVAKRRGGAWLMRNGRAVEVDAADALAKHDWLVVAEAQGRAGGARLLLGAPIEAADVEALFGGDIETVDDVRVEKGGVVAERVRRLGAITLSRGPLANPPQDAVRAALAAALADGGIDALRWSEAGAGLRARVGFLRGLGEDLPDLSDAALAAVIDVGDARRLSDIDTDAALAALVDWGTRQRIERLAPARLETPAGTSHAVDYAAEAGPTVSVRVQELFGLAAHPCVAGGRVPLVLSLLSPAQRPIQTTRDLPGFWRGSWAAVKAEMTGRYPKHPWPDDPAAARPTTRTKAADARRGLL